jgi:hypothetical protein
MVIKTLTFEPLVSPSKKESVVLETLDGLEFEKLCGRIFEKLQYGHAEVVYKNSFSAY